MIRSDNSCSVPLMQGVSVVIDVTYNPVCIGSHALEIDYASAVGSGKITGTGVNQVMKLILQ